MLAPKGGVMFKWFKRKPRESGAQQLMALTLWKVAEPAIRDQLPSATPTDAAKVVLGSLPASGYVLGFHDRLIELLRLGYADESWEVDAVRSSYLRIFGDDGGGSAVYGFAVAHMSEPDFVAGYSVGAEDAMRLRGQHVRPAGLADLLTR